MMKEDSFLTVLKKIEAKLKLMQEKTADVRLLYNADTMTACYGRTLQLAAVAEQTTLLSRSLPCYTGNRKASTDVKDIVGKSIQIEIGFTALNWFSLRIPMLLPKKETGSADYIRSSLYPAMRDFFLSRQPKRFKDSVLIYRHVYDRRRPDRKKRDHDNIEINMVTDIVAMYVMQDDQPDICSHYYCSAEGTTERTEVYVVPREDFSLWLAVEGIMPDEGITLYGNVPLS